MKRNNSKTRRLAKQARNSFRQPWVNPWPSEEFPSFAGACRHCGGEVNGEGFLVGGLADGAPMRLCRPCGRRLLAQQGG